MAWQGIEGHDDVARRFGRALELDRLASSFLFVGPSGVGKRAFALKLAQTLLCQARPPAAMEPCGACDGCVQTLSGSHPDLATVGKPADKNFLPLELLIGDAEHRLQEGLCHQISLKPFAGGRKVAIIDDADYLNVEGANCLLKTLEEPPPKSVLVLIGTSEQRQLPTIRSRCQPVRFRPLPTDVVARLLVERGLLADVPADEAPALAAELAALGGGGLERALQFADRETRDFRAGVLERLANPLAAREGYAKTVNTFVEQAGKENPPRRQRARLVIESALEFHHQLMRRVAGAAVEGDPALLGAVERAARRRLVDPETAAARALRCQEALVELESNAQIATLLECWLDELE